MFVRCLGITIFVLAFVPLIFGGTIYRMLEKVMSLKLILILGYLTFVAVFLVSPHNMWEVRHRLCRVRHAMPSGPRRSSSIPISISRWSTTPIACWSKGRWKTASVMIGQYQINGVTQSNDKLSPRPKRRVATRSWPRPWPRCAPASFSSKRSPRRGPVLSVSGRVDEWPVDRREVFGHRCRRRAPASTTWRTCRPSMPRGWRSW